MKRDMDYFFHKFTHLSKRVLLALLETVLTTEENLKKEYGKNRRSCSFSSVSESEIPSTCSQITLYFSATTQAQQSRKIALYTVSDGEI